MSDEDLFHRVTDLTFEGPMSPSKIKSIVFRFE